MPPPAHKFTQKNNTETRRPGNIQKTLQNTDKKTPTQTQHPPRKNLKTHKNKQPEAPASQIEN